MSKRLKLLGLAFTAVAAMTTSAFAETKEITIGLPSVSVVGGSIRIADQMGLFEKNGLKSDFPKLDSGAVAMAALVSGSLDAAVLGTSELAVANSKGQNLVIVANTYGGYGATLVLAKGVAEATKVAPDAPLQDRLKALDGLTLAAPSPTSDYTFGFKASAENVGAKPEFTFMAQTAMAAALGSGAIDGFISSSPNWGAQVLNGTAVVWISGPKGELEADFTPVTSAQLQMPRETIEKDPALAQALAQVVADFVAAIRNDPASVKAALVALYPNLSSEEIDLLFDANAGPWSAPELTEADLMHDFEFAKRTGILSDISMLKPADMLLK